MCKVNKYAKRVYLAVPYSGLTHEESFWWANIATAYLMERKLGGGYAVFSPISHSHPVSEVAPYLDNDHSQWLTQDYPHVAGAEILFVLKLKGWDKSFGVGFEIGVAIAHSIEVVYLDPEPIEDYHWRRKKETRT